MKSKSLNLLIAAGLSLFPALTHASVDSFLKLDLTYYYQEKSSSTEDGNSGKVKTARLDAKQLLDLIGKQLGANFPKGSQLKVAVDGKVYVTDSDGNTLRDVSQYLEANISTKNRLFDGAVNHVTRKEDSRNYFPISFTVELPGLEGTVEGIAIESFKVAPANKDGVQISTGQIDSKVSGKGLVGAGTAYFEGTMQLKGRQAIILAN